MHDVSGRPASSAGVGVPTGADERPWFQRHPWMAITVAASLAAAIFSLRVMVHGADDAIAMLYVLPIALVAMAFGRLAGTVAGAVGFTLLAIWALMEGVHLSPLGWLSRAIPLVLIGVLVGGATDRIREAHRVERQMVALSLLQREGAEIHDTVVQGLAASKWLLEAGDSARALELIEDAIVTAEGLVARTLGAQSVLPPDVRHPHLAVRPGRPSTHGRDA